MIKRFNYTLDDSLHAISALPTNVIKIPASTYKIIIEAKVNFQNTDSSYYVPATVIGLNIMSEVTSKLVSNVNQNAICSLINTANSLVIKDKSIINIDSTRLVDTLSMRYLHLDLGNINPNLQVLITVEIFYD